MNFEMPPLNSAGRIPPPEYSNGGYFTRDQEDRAGICRCRQCGSAQLKNPLSRCFYCEHPLWPIHQVERDRRHFSILYQDLTLEALQRLPGSTIEEYTQYEERERSAALRKLKSNLKYYQDLIATRK